MIPIYEVKTIQIEITNACNLTCANCTRFVGHHRKPFYMDIETVKKAIGSLEGYSYGIGLMGGEPTIHPQFREICKIYQEMIPDKRRRQFWTNGCKWEEYEDIINETFYPEQMLYNDHKDPNEGAHQPILIAAKDVVEDEELMWQLIDKCWIQKRWSASITPKGAFFCEVAAAQDHLFDGPGGYPVEKGWWKKEPSEFQDQVSRYCSNCSAAIPMPRPSSHEESDLISKSNAVRLEKANSPKYRKGKMKLFDKVLTKEDIEKLSVEWTPWSHRSYKQCTPDLIVE